MLSQVTLGRAGVEKVHPVALDAFEAKKLEEALPELKAAIDKGVQFGKTFAL